MTIQRYLIARLPAIDGAVVQFAREKDGERIYEWTPYASQATRFCYMGEAEEEIEGGKLPVASGTLVVVKLPQGME